MTTESFADLHTGPVPLLLPNAWDVGSALGFVDAGFPAVGTTSFGVSASGGVPDAGRASRQATEHLVRRLRTLPAHITADIEDGYSDDPAEVADFVATLGVAGINIEDSTQEELNSPADHAAKIAAVKAATPEVFVNARVDTFWLNQGRTVRETVDRALTYVDAGADGVFVPGATEPFDLEQLAAALPVPLNVLVVPGLTLRRLGELGIRRVSTGSLPYRAAMDAAVRIAEAVRDGTDVAAATSYAQVQARLQAYADLQPDGPSGR